MHTTDVDEANRH